MGLTNGPSPHVPLTGYRRPDQPRRASRQTRSGDRERRVPSFQPYPPQASPPQARATSYEEDGQSISTKRKRYSELHGDYDEDIDKDERDGEQYEETVPTLMLQTPISLDEQQQGASNLINASLCANCPFRSLPQNYNFLQPPPREWSPVGVVQRFETGHDGSGVGTLNTQANWQIVQPFKEDGTTGSDSTAVLLRCNELQARQDVNPRQPLFMHGANLSPGQDAPKFLNLEDCLQNGCAMGEDYAGRNTPTKARKMRDEHDPVFFRPDDSDKPIQVEKARKLGPDTTKGATPKHQSVDRNTEQENTTKSKEAEEAIKVQKDVLLASFTGTNSHTEDSRLPASVELQTIPNAAVEPIEGNATSFKYSKQTENNSIVSGLYTELASEGKPPQVEVDLGEQHETGSSKFFSPTSSTVGYQSLLSTIAGLSSDSKCQEWECDMPSPVPLASSSSPAMVAVSAKSLSDHNKRQEAQQLENSQNIQPYIEDQCRRSVKDPTASENSTKSDDLLEETRGERDSTQETKTKASTSQNRIRESTKQELNWLSGTGMVKAKARFLDNLQTARNRTRFVHPMLRTNLQYAFENRPSAPAEQAPASSVPAQLAPAQSPPAQPAPAQSPPAQPAPAQSPPAQSPPPSPPTAQQAPAQPAPAQPAPAQSPAQPSLAQPAPAQPAPAQSPPAQSPPAQSPPAQSPPSSPPPAQPSLAQPSPAQPAPAQSPPSSPAPAQPAPAQPAPAQPSLASPAPTQPATAPSTPARTLASQQPQTATTKVEPDKPVNVYQKPITGTSGPANDAAPVITKFVPSQEDDLLEEITHALSGTSGSGKPLEICADLTSHFALVGKFMLEMYTHDRMTDIMVHVGKHSFSGHKAVLACHSPYLAQLLGSLPQSQTQRIVGGISLDEDITPVSFQLLLQYMYTGKISASVDTVSELLRAASKLGLKTVENQLRQGLEHLSMTDILTVMETAAAQGIRQLVLWALQKIVQDFPTVVLTERFLELDVSCLTQILSHDNLRIATEYEAAEAAVRWLGHAYKQRLVHLRRVMSCVRFGFLTSKELLKLALKAEFLLEDEVVKNDILESNWYQSVSEAGYAHLSKRPVPKPRTKQLKPSQNEVGKTKGQSAKDNTKDKVQETSSTLRPLTLFAIGGYNPDSATPAHLGREVLKYHPDHGTWERLVRLPLPRIHHAVAVLDGRIYVVGGSDSGEEELQAQKTVFSWTADPGAEWSECQPMLLQRTFHCMATLNGKLYALGGQDQHGAVLSSVETYDPKQDRWTTVAPMHCRRIGANVVSHLGVLLVAGGYGNRRAESGRMQNRVLDGVEYYDPTVNTWIELPPLSTPRCFAAMTLCQEKLVICGGLTSGGDQPGKYNLLSSVEQYDEDNEEWQQVATLDTPRYDAGIYTSGSKVLLIGGLTTQNLATASIESYDVATATHSSKYPDFLYAAAGCQCVSF